MSEFFHVEAQTSPSTWARVHASPIGRSRPHVPVLQYVGSIPYCARACLEVRTSLKRPVTGGSWPVGVGVREGCACLRALLCQSVFNNRFRSFRTRSIARPASTEFGSQQLRSLKSESLQIKATQSEAHSSRSTRRGRLAACSPATCRLQLAISFLLLSYPSAGLVCALQTKRIHGMDRRLHARGVSLSPARGRECRLSWRRRRVHRTRYRPQTPVF